MAVTERQTELVCVTCGVRLGRSDRRVFSQEQLRLHHMQRQAGLLVESLKFQRPHTERDGPYILLRLIGHDKMVTMDEYRNNRG